MKRRELVNLGIPEHIAGAAMAACGEASRAGRSHAEIRAGISRAIADPPSLASDEVWGPLARALAEAAASPQPTITLPHACHGYAVWGAEEIDDSAKAQMSGACRLPVSAAGALMPDAHVGYGLPIGGVWATRDAVVPYAVGVDIACRMMMTVFELPPESALKDRERLETILERCTLFGVGKGFKRPPEHDVLDEDWSVTGLTSRLKDTARAQLGTSGSGNHFVEFGELDLLARPEGADGRALPMFGDRSSGGGERAHQFLAVLSHSGSRGPGAQVCSHYSRVARERHKNLPKELSYLAWLPLSGPGSEEGREYWAAMELMGKFASANHHVIHRKIARELGAPIVAQVENHHNFAWKERHVIAGREEEVVVHRKGATPAGRGVLGLIPGSMAAPGYLVEGLGEPRSLRSASHGAGRRLSRTKARESIRWNSLRAFLEEKGVHLLSAGLDESPHAYKDIEMVMAAQADLVRPLARFTPRIVKMAPEGEKAED